MGDESLRDGSCREELVSGHTRMGIRRRLQLPLRRFLGADGAVSALEYAMVVGIVAIAVAAAIAVFAGDYKAPITAIAGKVGAISTPAIKTTP